MMAALFLLFALSMLFLFIGMRKWAGTLAFITLVLCAFMLMHHATSTLGIRF